VCQSMGGWTGLGYALANPDRVWALVMSHTVGGLATAATDAARRRVQAQGHTPSEPFGSWALDLDLPDTNPTLSHLYNCIYAQNRDFLEIGGINAFGRKRPEVDTTQVAGFAVPTLFVTGDKDVVIPADAVEAAHAELPHSELVNLGPVGHSSYFETAAAFNETVGGFLARHSPAS
jgi:pimeloyl-ACP methyl ester carboxylesterase